MIRNQNIFVPVKTICLVLLVSIAFRSSAFCFERSWIKASEVFVCKWYSNNAKMGYLYPSGKGNVCRWRYLRTRVYNMSLEHLIVLGYRLCHLKIWLYRVYIMSLEDIIVQGYSLCNLKIWLYKGIYYVTWSYNVQRYDCTWLYKGIHYVTSSIF